MRRTGSHPCLITQNFHSMGTILHLKCQEDFTPRLMKWERYWLSTLNEVLPVINQFINRLIYTDNRFDNYYQFAVLVCTIAGNFHGMKFSRMASKMKFSDKSFADAGLLCRTRTHLCLNLWILFYPMLANCEISITFVP